MGGGGWGLKRYKVHIDTQVTKDITLNFPFLKNLVFTSFGFSFPADYFHACENVGQERCF